MRHTREMATLRRSFQLLRSFRFEQTHPEIFYGGLAEDTAALVYNLGRDLGVQLAGARVLDSAAARAILRTPLPGAAPATWDWSRMPAKCLRPAST